jgi:hypothetical protein
MTGSGCSKLVLAAAAWSWPRSKWHWASKLCCIAHTGELVW